MYQNAPRLNVMKVDVIMLCSVSFWRKSATENEILLHVKPNERMTCRPTLFVSGKIKTGIARNPPAAKKMWFTAYKHVPDLSSLVSLT